MSRCKVALGSFSLVGRRVTVGHFPLYHASRHSMIRVAMGAGVWYRARWFLKSWSVLVQAACQWVLGHWSMCVTFSLRFPQAKHRWLILLSIWACWCNVGVHSWAYFEIWIFFPGESASKDDLLACQSTLLKVSSVHSASMRGSHFFESLLLQIDSIVTKNTQGSKN
jgi:hypothetical protein